MAALAILFPDRVGAVDYSFYPEATRTDPFALVKDDLNQLAGSVKELIGVDHPVLSTVAK